VPFLVDFSQKFEQLLNNETGFACSKHSSNFMFMVFFLCSNLCEVCAEDEERIDHLLCSPSGLLWLLG